MIWLYISTGLFLGWSLGANHAVNVFGTAVTSRMVKFRTAAAIAGVFVILGAVVSGAGATRTLNDLGSVNALAGCFTVALAVGLAITWMTRLNLPVSTSQSVVGGIVGWNLFTGSPTDMTSLAKVLSTWIICPLLAAAIAYVLFLIAKRILAKTKMHVLRLDAYTRIGFLVIGAFASYSLGANNIGNVMGMFVPASPFDPLALIGSWSLNSAQQLFFLGGIAIAIGIYTYSYRVMKTVGNELYKITPVAGLLVVLAESLVLFLFASEGLETWLVNHKLPAIPLVPLSSTQIVIGAVIGVGWARGGKGINYRVLGKIGIGWIVAPVVSACIAFIGLFIVQNVFEQKVVESVPYRLNRATIVELKAQGIEEAPLKKLEGKKFYSSGSFRQALWNQKQWKEQELYLIFSYAHLDTIKIDSNRAKLLIESTEITPAQRQALLILHGRQFAYHWQLEKALIEGSDEWNILEGRENERHNKNVQQLKRALYDAFGRK